MIYLHFASCISHNQCITFPYTFYCPLFNFNFKLFFTTLINHQFYSLAYIYHNVFMHREMRQLRENSFRKQKLYVLNRFIFEAQIVKISC